MDPRVKKDADYARDNMFVVSKDPADMALYVLLMHHAITVGDLPKTGSWVMEFIREYREVRQYLS